MVRAMLVPLAFLALSHTSVPVSALHMETSTIPSEDNEPLSKELRRVHSELTFKGNLSEHLDKLNERLMSRHPGELFEGNTDNDEVAVQQQQYIQWAQTTGAKKYCETGFNAGHSALVWLSESDAQVYEFDLGSHAYGASAESFLQEQFPNRLNVTWGDSTETIPEFSRAHPDIKCDVVVVDGGHSNVVAKADLMNFAKMAAPGHLLVIDDTPCDGGACPGPREEWKALLDEGCVSTHKEVSMSTTRGYTYGIYTPCPLWPDMAPGRAA